MGRNTADVSKSKSRSLLEAGAIVCPWCGRIRKGDGGWQRPVAPEAEVNVRHGICPTCREGLIKDFIKSR